MSPEPWQVAVGLLGVILGPSGAAWLVLKTTLNGTGERVQKIDERTERMSGDISKHGERLARIETRLEDRTP